MPTNVHISVEFNKGVELNVEFSAELTLVNLLQVRAVGVCCVENDGICVIPTIYIYFIIILFYFLFQKR